MSTRAELPAGLPLGNAMTWPEMAGVLADLHASAPGRYALRDSFMALRQLDEELKSMTAYRPAPDVRWVIINRHLYVTTDTAIAAWQAGTRANTPPGSERRYTLVDVAPPAPLDNLVAFPAPKAAPDGWTMSTAHPGLLKKVDRENLSVSFRMGRAEATFDLRTGAVIDQSDRGDFPPATWQYIAARVRELPAPHRRIPQKEEAARPGAASVVQPTQAGALPILGAAPTPVKEEVPMLDLSNPTVVAQARAIAMNINKSVGIPEIEAVRKTLKANYGAVERAYRQAEVNTDEARRRLAEMKQALKDRSDELLLVASDVRVEGTKPKYSTASSLATAVKAALKADAAYLAIQTEEKVAVAQLKAAANDDKPGIEQLIAQKREALAARELALQEQLQAETVMDSSPRYTSAEARGAAAINMRKTDAEYLAIKAEVGKAEQALYQAELAFASAKADQRILTREWADLDKANDLAVARINAFGGLDAPAPVPTQPAMPVGAAERSTTMTTDISPLAAGAVSLASGIPLVGMEDYTGAEFRLPRLAIIQTMDQMKEFGGQPGEIHNSLTAENLKSIDVTVLASKKNRWLGPDFLTSQDMRAKGQEVKAFCKSSDGNVPDADVVAPKCSACKICPLGTPQRGADGGWEPAPCTEIRKVLVKLPDESVGMLTVRNKAVREIDAFVQRFYMQKKNLFTVRASLATKEEKGKLNTYFLPALAPRYDQPVPDEEQVELYHSIALYADFFAAQAADAAVEEQQAAGAGGDGAIDVTATAQAPAPMTPPAPPQGQMPSVDDAGF